MSELKLIKLRMIAGLWQGELTGVTGDAPPALIVSQGAEALPAPTLNRLEDGKWLVEVPVPADRLGDGVQTFVISTRDTGDTLASFAFMGGEALSNDIRAELDLLRDELDMLKRAFRRHCVETAGN
ncbi:hypothetical protein SAMN05428995_10755 [Loktanella sp. DSM 29012]|uniref:Uncharacterized protein n=1 Tax=Loktanella gaetbuli TaxID=2881335 RepID=A0ABS8BSX5_9RHOB|nr:MULTISPECIES: hypothetical protein [Loktanella]MCB5198835.1 hypothetical protein [Loktanella gaetbuli]SEQ73768.1 hypothetical protein SAMN05428995_10755 [Loktanella sp. DSM 29012]